MRSSATSLNAPGRHTATQIRNGDSAGGSCGVRVKPRSRQNSAQKFRPKTKTPETCVPGAFRMSLKLTGSSSPVSLGWGCEFPRLLHPLMLLPAPILESPRLSRPLALIASGLQVAPNSRSGDRLPVHPQVALIAAPSGLACGESPGCPGPSLRLRRLPANFQVSLAIVPSGSTG